MTRMQPAFIPAFMGQENIELYSFSPSQQKGIERILCTTNV